jgi:hypothetical protein
LFPNAIAVFKRFGVILVAIEAGERDNIYVLWVGQHAAS